MPTLRINKGSIPTEVIVPPSKSYANRALILASLKKNQVTLKSVPQATDVLHLINALRALHLSIHQTNDTVTVENSFPECEREGAEIEVGEGGTTARFLACLLLLGKKPYTLILGKRLKERPWDEFLRFAHELGARASLKGERLTIQGPIKAPEKLSVYCSRTTQFATGMDLVLTQTEIIPENLSSSQSYFLMNAPLKEFLLQHDSYCVPSDWSSAAYPMVFAALNQTIRFPSLAYDPFQADAKLLTVLNDLGAVETQEKGLVVKKMLRPQAIELEMNDCLDLFPAMAFLVSHIEGTHRLSGLENLVHKESNRLEEVIRLLKLFRRKQSFANNVLTIEGNSEIIEAQDLILPDDHRMVMTAALFLRHHNGGSVTPFEAVTKSYPDFFDLLK